MIRGKARMLRLQTRSARVCRMIDTPSALIICCRNVSTAGKPKPKRKTAPRGCRCRLRSPVLLGGLQELLIRQRLAALDDGERLDLAAFHGEDGHLGVLAVAFVVELDVS